MSSYLGQNFLINTRITQWISQTVYEHHMRTPLQYVIEIGPGKTAVTKHIVQRYPDVIVCEKDTTFEPLLYNLLKPDHVLWGDVLETFPLRVAQHRDDSLATYIVGNLPYYITSPILSMIAHPLEQEQVFAGALVMIQMEVGEKIKKDADKKSYLRWICNYRYNVVYRKTVKASSFKPAPRVDSCIIEFIPKSILPEVDPVKMFMVLDLISPYKRKTIAKSIKLAQKHSGIDCSGLIMHPERTRISMMRLEECGREEMKVLTTIVTL